MDGFSKIPGFIAPTIRERLSRGESIRSVIRLPVLFLLFLERWHAGALEYAYQDQVMSPATGHAICSAADPVAAFVEDRTCWGDLAGNADLYAALAHARRELPGELGLSGPVHLRRPA